MPKPLGFCDVLKLAKALSNPVGHLIAIVPTIFVWAELVAAFRSWVVFYVGNV